MPETFAEAVPGAAALAELAALGSAAGPAFEVSPAAPCVLPGADAEAWHPPVGSPAQQLAEARHARRQCAGCPVQTKSECLSYALRHEQYGVWGGTTAHDRAGLRSRREPLMVTVMQALASQEKAAAAEAENARILAAGRAGKQRVREALPLAASDR